MLGSKTPRFRSIKSALQSNSIPNSCFYGFSLDFCFAQRGDIFWGRVPYFGFMPLSLFFQKCWVYEKGYKKAYEKEDLVYWKRLICLLACSFQVQEGFRNTPELLFLMGGQRLRSASEEHFPNSQVLWHITNNPPYFVQESLLHMYGG